MGKVKNSLYYIIGLTLSGWFTFLFVYIWTTPGHTTTETFILSIIPFIAGPLSFFYLLKSLIKDLKEQKSQKAGLFDEKPIYSHIVRGIYISIIVALLIFLVYLMLFTDTFQ